MKQRSFRRYKYYYELLSDFPRFKHCTLSFNELRDKIPKVRQWFESNECIELPLTDCCSRYYWKGEPTEFHNFDTIVAVNNPGDELSSDIESDENEEETEDNTEPLTKREFKYGTHWLSCNADNDSHQMCAICKDSYERGCKLSVLDCNHRFHTNCVERWLTTRSSLCPLCRFNVRTTQ